MSYISVNNTMVICNLKWWDVMGRAFGRPALFDVKVGSRIAFFRIRFGLSQQALAQNLKVGLRDVQMFESGVARPSASQFVCLCDLLNILPSELLSDEFD